ncbi:flavin reductase [Desulfovibrio aminophilus]|uniref:flavin reductase family protein n=1 Tax=Desulfovibrio aminophilus TaxID=81425 RepID=UPI003399E828
MKAKLGAVNALYPSLTVLVGAVVHGRPNFITVAHVGIVNLGQPQLLSISLRKARHTSIGIREHREFSICLPSEDMVAETDYVGMVSGKDTDKSEIFSLFKGGLPHAPLIARCPVCMELTLRDTLDLETHDLFIGAVEATWADEDVTLNGRVDFAKLRPLLYDPLHRYWSIGQVVADAWSVGKTLMKKDG